MSATERIPETMQQQSAFFYLEKRDGADAQSLAKYERLLEFMVFAMIRANHNIRHHSLLVLCEGLNVPHHLAERAIKMCISQAACIPDQPNQRLVFANTAHDKEGGERVRVYSLNRNVNWPEFVSTYSGVVGFDLSSFRAPLYTPKRKEDE